MTESGNCKKCKKELIFEYGEKQFKNCKECRESINQLKKNKPKYDPNIQRICIKCHQVKNHNPDFLVRIEKKSNICSTCRGLPKPEKSEQEIDVDKLLNNVKKNLLKIMEPESVRNIMVEIENHFEESDAESI